MFKPFLIFFFGGALFLGSAFFVHVAFFTPTIVYDNGVIVGAGDIVPAAGEEEGSGTTTSKLGSAAEIEAVRSQSEAGGQAEEAAGSVPIPAATHLPTPSPLRAIYMTSWVAGTPAWRAHLVGLIEETELNAVVIDIKDWSGRISFKVSDPYLREIGSAENRIPDIREFIELLHRKGIYVIGRITVFQDPYLAAKRPDFAIRKESDKSEVWKDYKQLAFLDPGAKEVWDYAVAVAKESYAAGFDELNFDYIRYPSDGPMQDIYYPWSEERVTSNWRYGKAHVLRDFFAYLKEELGDTDAVLSADLFGMVTTNVDDLNVGQVLDFALPYFDYIAPMTYPSHYPSGFIGIPNPNTDVYRVIRYSMDRAIERMSASTTRVAALGDTLVATGTAPLYRKDIYAPEKLRPWLQDFDYGGIYGAGEVRAQIQAVYDAGLDSWMLWDPANEYTRDALLSAE